LRTGPFIQVKMNKIICCLAALLLWFSPLSASCLRNACPDPEAGIVLADCNGNVLYEHNSTKLFVPASILKLVTSLAAIHILGENYRFTTEYGFNKRTGNLYIKGFGDPMFISEVIQMFCRDLISNLKIKKIHDIVLDHSYFADRIQIPGQSDTANPYDAPVGALCANFNTIAFDSDTAAGQFISAEPQTPLLPVFEKIIKKTGLARGRIILDRTQAALYAGQLIRYWLEKSRIKITGKITKGQMHHGQCRKWVFFSPFTLKENIKKLLRYSSNFMANQLALTIGAVMYGPPATLEKAVKALKFYSESEIGINNPEIFEGSGLSRMNRISPAQMLKVLIKLKPWYFLLRHGQNDFFKTGTLTGIRTRAGYIEWKSQNLYPYVIMVNEKDKDCEKIKEFLAYYVLRIVHQDN